MATPQAAETESLTVYMRKPEALEKFINVLGNEQEAQKYIQSVLIEATSDEKLKDCTPQSILKSALRAASLGLSCDKSLKQAWLVPYNRNIAKRGEQARWVKEAQFQPHYKGLHTLAMRTNKYWIINCSPVYDGQRVLEDPLTGLHKVVETNGFVGEPKAYNPGLVDVTDRRRRDMRVIGWLAYFKAKNGYQKSVYMSVQEIEDHAQKYVKDYLDKDGNIANPNWKDQDKRQVMEMKTVLRQLLSWADLSGKENAKLAEALQADVEPDDEPIEATAEPVSAPASDIHPMTVEEARETIAKINGKDKRIGDISSADDLNWLIENSLLVNVVEAAKLVLHEDFRMEPTERPSKESLQKDLGF